MSSCGSNADTVTSTLPVNVIVNNALFHSSPHINQTLRRLLFWKKMSISNNDYVAEGALPLMSGMYR